MTDYSPLRYPGGKSKLANFFKKIIEDNNLFDGHYVEPYAGGAGVALTLLFEEFASHIHINDINNSIYAFWYAVLHHTEELCRMVKDAPITINEWNRQKRAQQFQGEYTTLELGFSTFYLNRTNRSGIIRGGVIGGKRQLGKWKLDARFNKTALIQRIEKIALFKKRITIYHFDASDLIKEVIPTLPLNTLVYLDPPYFVKGQGLYENHYSPDDHASVSKLITDRIKQNWVVSYDNNDEILKLYKKHHTLIYDLSYSAAKKYRGSEVMFFCEQLSVPSVENPMRI